MKNAIKVFCFVLAAIVIGTSATWFYFKWDKNRFEIEDGSEVGTATIVSYVGDLKEITIPKRVRGKKITAIGERAFRETAVTSIKINGNIKSIGEGVFLDCKDLKSVELCEGVRSIGESCFLNCYSLENVSIPSTLEKIGEGSFTNTAVKNLDFSNNDYFKLENGVLYTSDMTTVVLALDSADLSDYTCPSTVNTILSYAFAGHKEIKSFKLNDGIKILNASVFGGCTGLTELVLPDSVVSIAPLSISSSGIKKIYIPKTTVTIDKTAFYNMEEQLTIVTPADSAAAKYAKETGIKCITE